MGLFRRDEPKPPCPACGEVMENGHTREHVRPVDGGFIFECSCGVSTMKWTSEFAAETAMEIHCDRDHGTKVSVMAGSVGLHSMYRDFFPSGEATQPVRETAPAPPPTPSSAPDVDIERQREEFFDYMQTVDLDRIPEDWDDLRKEIVEVHRRMPNVTVDDESTRDFLAFTIGAPSGRSQVVVVSHIEGDQGPDWFQVQSPFSGYDPRLAVAAVDYVAREENWGVGVARMDDSLLLRWSGAVGMVTIFHLMSMIDGVAGQADRLESELSGGRDVF